MKKVLITIVSLSAFTLNAADISYAGSATGAQPLSSLNVTLPTDSLVRLGTFAPGTNFSSLQNDIAALNAAFTQYDTTLIRTIFSRAGSFSDTVTVPAITGTQLYLWIFNTGDRTTATEHGIFSGATWIAPGDVPPANAIQFGLQTVTTAHVGSIAPVGAGQTGKLAVIEAAVPEPSTYALMGLGLVVVGFMARRRK